MHTIESSDGQDYVQMYDVLETVKRYSAKEDTAESYEWCTGCKEYDNEKHCCHRYTNFIRYSLQENIDSVLEDIKAEIDNESIGYPPSADYYKAIKKAVRIIEKHISGKENE